MIVRPGLFLLLLIVSTLCLAPDDASAKNKPTDAAPLPQNEITGKAPSNYLALSRLHLPVLVDQNRQYRSLELEVWLLPTDEQNLALARSAKKAIMAALQEDFSNYDWEAFQDSRKGTDIAKKIITTGVQRASGAKLEDVLIKTLVLR